MKNKFILALIFTLFAASVIPVQGMELEVSGGLGNIYFNPENTEFLGDEEDPQPFAPGLLPIIRSIVSGEIGDTVYYSGGFEYDPILRNRVFANIGLRLGFLNIGAGTFIGILNTEETFNPGVSAAFGLEFPGIFFANVQAMSSIGGFQAVGSYSQRGGILTAGFWIPNIIFTLNLETRSYALQKEPNLLMEDRLTRYFIRADIYAKNNPFSFRLDIGYGSLVRSYTSQEIVENEDDDGYFLDRVVPADELKYIYMGLKAAYVINPLIKVFIAGEMPVYSWSVLPMKNPDKDKVLFQAQVGVVFSFQ
jgi:hypothetical protein